MASTEGCETVRWSESLKAGLSSDRGLQLDPVKSESLVIADQQRCGEYVPAQRFDFESSSDNFEEGTHMIFGQRESNSYFAAIFSYDFLDEGLGYETIARIHRGEICEWIRDLEASGLFSAAEVHAAELAWRENPRLLLDALLEDADEVSVKRWEIAWTRLERQSPAAGTAVAEHG